MRRLFRRVSCRVRRAMRWTVACSVFWRMRVSTPSWSRCARRSMGRVGRARYRRGGISVCIWLGISRASIRSAGLNGGVRTRCRCAHFCVLRRRSVFPTVRGFRRRGAGCRARFTSGFSSGCWRGLRRAVRFAARGLAWMPRRWRRTRRCVRSGGARTGRVTARCWRSWRGRAGSRRRAWRTLFGSTGSARARSACRTRSGFQRPIRMRGQRR